MNLVKDRRGTMNEARSSAHVTGATPHALARQYSKRGAAGDARQVNMFYLMQKYGAKRDFLKEEPQNSQHGPSQSKKMGFVVRFSLSGAYQALERQELEASVPQITPVRVVRKRAILVKRSALGSIPEGTTAVSTRGSPDRLSNPQGGSTVVSRSTTAKSKHAAALEQMKAQNQQKLLWKTLASKALGHTEQKAASSVAGLTLRKVVTQKLTQHNIAPKDQINDVTDDSMQVALPNVLSRQNSGPVSTRRSSHSLFDLDNLKDSLQTIEREQLKLSKSKHRTDSKKQDKVQKLNDKSKDYKLKTSRNSEKTDKISLVKKQGKHGRHEDSTKAKKLEKRASKQNLVDGEVRVSAKKKGKTLEAEVFQPLGSKLYQTMMRQTLGGKRPDDLPDDSTSVDTLARFLTTNASYADEETVTASEMPHSRLSCNASDSKMTKTKNAINLDNISPGRETSKNGLQKENQQSGKEKKGQSRREEDRQPEQSKRKVCRYLYHMCNCRYIGKPDTLNRLYKKKQNVAGVIEIYGCPQDEEKGDSPIVCPFCTVFPRERVHAWLEELESDEEETAPHHKQ